VAYEARQNDMYDEEIEKEMQRAQNDAANQRAVQDAAAIAANSGHAVAAAIGKGVQIGDKVTGGKVSEILGKGVTRTNEHAPLGKAVQGLTNKAATSGAADIGEKALAAKQTAKAGEKGGQVRSPSSADKGSLPGVKDGATPSTKKTTPSEAKGSDKKGGGLPKDKLPEKAPDNKSDTEDKNVSGIGFGMTILLPILPFLVPLALIIVVIIMVAGNGSEYQDAFGVNQEIGGDTGGMNVSISDPKQQEFYRRVVGIKNEYQQEGKEINPIRIVAVYHVLSKKQLVNDYDSMTDSKIRAIADAVYADGTYDDTVFKDKLVNQVFPSYSSSLSKKERELMVDEVFEYEKNYDSLIGKKEEDSCYDGDSCTYDIKGYRLNSTKKSSETKKVDNLYVRLMQCGKGAGRDYGGTFGQPLGEELVPFEKYVLGAAYAEMGPNTEQAFKTQLVVARSFTLARHADTGGWRSLKKEGDKWVLQLGNCTLDQLYCDPDKGCSRDSRSSGYHLRSGTSGYAQKYKDPISENSPLRKYAKETAGEVLVDNNGYIIQTGFLMAENRQFNNLAKSGFNYKQILLTVYNSGNRRYGASSISRANCGNTCVDSSEAAKWKQYEGQWTSVKVGTSGKTIKQIGCLATAIAIQIKRSGVPTNISGEFNPGTFVSYLNTHGGFAGGDLNWSGPTAAAPTFKFQNKVYLSGMNREQKLNKIKEIISQEGVYAVCEVKGNTGQHWVAIDKVDGNGIKMMDPGSASVDMWSQYNWANTSQIVYYKVG